MIFYEFRTNSLFNQRISYLLLGGRLIMLCTAMDMLLRCNRR